MRLMSLENSKAAHHLPVVVTATTSNTTLSATSESAPEPHTPEPQITRIAWSRSRMGQDMEWIRNLRHSPSPQYTWPPRLEGKDDDDDGEDKVDSDLSELVKLDLPSELAFLDIESSWPNVSPLPNTSAGPG